MTLYAHRPRSLLPLLREQLPYTTVMVATILANDELPPVYATFSTRDDGYINLGWLESIGVDGWLVTVALPRPSEQIRIYHSAVAKGATPDPDTISLAIREMARMYPEQRMVGETHELLAPLVRGIVGGPERTRTYIYVAPDGGFGLTDIKEADIELDQGLPEDAPTVSAFASPLTLRSTRPTSTDQRHTMRCAGRTPPAYAALNWKRGS
jgi:hypothetical protein